ncbi:oxysterol binding protein 9 [Capsaspora owczarzaki ATCC 30864]|uniref:Oxysterol binding protein 9 n=1 Tax=Capsaspora owczarzaki (strain ATCC 30864) TaxID=595528 RepID=A0A0D2VT04_CAPO3|nr:oxysterol binding protein 9 [Capsaspora owczarzaki ATCC 30864]KJE94332.1 oxysterol binding protein 9 [Capsaspora owczarzaki ATCC 30864]|eukprot:XP_004346676.2 oxysterol binding protein 9 [Capsaspora owczarzaki ATCC 30864]
MQDSSDEEEEAPSDQKSVIFHLLKQLSIGMDLTKVTLPTFVLEKRSLLEMYADFMANPMAWLKVGDSNDPKERMMQCVFAYITSFHGFKKGTIAKKPYNPIIGETFECQYDLTAEGAGISTYFAEQVSHHPPVSAFYFENKQKGISIAADVWTQSKFLGTSVASLLVGQSTLTLHKRNEQYVMTYPNVYGRSILSVPKLELGGKTTIVCSQTGFTADVEFKTKPMFGGSYHELLCTVKEPNAKAPFVKISGKWNEVLVIQYTGAKEAPYFDAAKAIKVNKSVRALDVQAPFESRRLWKDVTENLRAGNIPAATAAKELLENRQRQEAAERKQANTEWKVKHFSKNDQGRWIYHHAA